MATNKLVCTQEKTSLPVVNPWRIFWIEESSFLLPRKVEMCSQKVMELNNRKST